MLCRVATLKAWPTDDELAASSFETAAEYLDGLRLSDEQALAALLAERATAWGAEPAGPPTERCVVHLIGVIVHTITSALRTTKAGRAGVEAVWEPAEQLTPQAVAKWISRCMRAK